MAPLRPTLIAGARFADARGVLACCNACDLAEVRRFYTLYHPDTTTVRGWNGHRFESKRFFCIKGAFAVGLVAVDAFEAPSPALQATCFRLQAEDAQVLCVPPGYANAIKALTPDSILLVLSDKTLEEAKDDNWKYPPERWVDWRSVT